jgi:predicted acylesterase/phospholipase RssA
MKNPDLRWLDEQGDIYFSDQVPLGHIQYSRATSSQTGRVQEVVTEQAQSKEQIEQESRLQELRRQQEKIIASQKVHDKALLSSYHSKEGMLLAIQSKMEVFDKQKDILKGI